MLRREHQPEAIIDFARNAEALGFDELWVVEDTFYSSGVAAAAAALSSTRTVSVGLGIMPAVVRNPVFTAMEIATIAGMFTGRFLPGIGHGSSQWMRDIGAMPASQLTVLKEVVQTVKALLGGERISFSGKTVHIDDGQLIHPPTVVPPISLGVVNRKSLLLSGKYADGTILSEYSNPAYIAWAKQIINSAMSCPEKPHHITVFMFASATDSVHESCDELRPLIYDAINSGKIDTKLSAMGILDEVKDKRESGSLSLNSVPDTWVKNLAIVGSPADWNEAILELVKAGADSVVVVPIPGKPLNEMTRFAKHLDLQSLRE
jgi:alkanesulfonate monooxygenase SsuD/methylene tetrahydromethanopterin reductase-like flavin-dependent oxidoreductase (luciferase family)